MVISSLESFEIRSLAKLISASITSFLALGIQEGVGHYIGGDIASRPEGVLNAIVYAMYFSVGHWF